jgi:hypothetical protein
MRSALFALLASLALGTTVDAAPKKTAAAGNGPVSHSPPACGAKILPLVTGNTWKYEAVVSPQPAIEAIAKIAPPEPKFFTITVKSVETQKGGDTVASLEEKVTYDLSRDQTKPKLDERTVNTTITCNGKGKFEISPDSYFFAGEPGGYFGMTLDKVERPRDTTLKLVNGSIGQDEWREDVITHFTRTPTAGVEAKLGSGKLELERKFTPAQPESVSTKMGGYMAEKLGLVTTGRVTLDNGAPDAKPMELPAGWQNILWLAPGVGMVQSLNAYAHMYQLTEVTLK